MTMTLKQRLKCSILQNATMSKYLTDEGSEALLYHKLTYNH